ncbi:YagK/YfjJ domain-containing protein [Limnobaculum parvum]|uniref:Inovirus Gp2 family protein n=1 Tax=Limnobaculum parvum TaxID=2172103 RepID=A0A2Y9TWV5_9GAMM|nr:inovirus-type Gp2 protein [Limnobaculum parvum]AWH87904.1 inovirus Gp2 family protein [Limnobaculum parvum]
MSIVNPNYQMNPFLLAQLHNHANALQARYSKLLAFRMDFSYLKDSPLFLQRTNDYSLCDMWRLAEMAMEFNDVIGYAWVMEYTSQHGIHFHAVFYLNGHRHQNYFPTAQGITHHWQDITRNQGVVYDCSRNTAGYSRQGQGRLNYTNRESSEALLYAISYLAKEDQKQGVYCYQVSWIGPHSGRGRPRKQ